MAENQFPMVDFLALGIVFHFGKCFFEVYEAQSQLTQRDVQSIAKRPLSFEHFIVTTAYIYSPQNEN